MRRLVEGLCGLIVLAASTGLFLIGSYELLLWAAHDWHPQFQEIDHCLDLGGMWQYEADGCVASGSSS